MSYLMNYTSAESLFTAVSNNDIPKLLSLIEKGVDITQRNDLEQTPLDICAFFGYFDMFKLLLANGADLYELNKWGESVKDKAHKGKQTEIMEFIKLVYDKKEKDLDIISRY